MWELTAQANIPFNNLGVFSINHQADFRDNYTYIIIRDRKNGTEQIFQLGVDKGKVKLHLDGTHDLTLQPQQDNKIVVDVDTQIGTMTLIIYPEGQRLANVSFEQGAEFVFLTDNRLHIEHPSFFNAIKNEKLYIEASSFFRQDDSIPLNSVEKVTFKRDFGISKLTIDWKQDIKANQKPIVIDMPKKSKSTLKSIQELQTTFATISPNIQFVTDYSNQAALIFQYSSNLWLILSIIAVYLLVCAARKSELFKMIGWLLFLIIWIGLGSLIRLQINASDPEYPTFETEIKNFQEMKKSTSTYLNAV